MVHKNHSSFHKQIRELSVKLKIMTSRAKQQVRKTINVDNNYCNSFD